ncbi:MAG: sodium:phosphate symporter [Haloarculaceae archaeon]
MTDRARETPLASLALLVLAVVSLAVAARAAPILWSPLPATLDGFNYAGLARATLATGSLPWDAGVLAADEIGFATVLATASAVTGVEPLYLAQPLVAFVGAAAPLAGIALARELVPTDWSARRVRTALALVGFGLALDGLFLRRTGVPDEEAVGLVLVPLLALAAWRWLDGGRHAWGGLSLLLLAFIPPLHNLSALLGLLTLTGLVALHAVRASRPGLVRAAGLAVLAWGDVFGYFVVTERFGLVTSYGELFEPYLGLFLAWVVLLVAGVVWVRGATPRGQRTAFLAPVGLGFLVVALNAVVPLFPGTIPSLPAVVFGLGGFVLPVVLAAVGLPAVRRGSGPAVLALFAAPAALWYYSLTASLTPEFFDAVVRIQSFAHVPVFVLAGVGAAGLATRYDLGSGSSPGPRRLVGPAAVALLLASVVATVPLAYVNLDTGTYPSTTLESEFGAAAFATGHVDGRYAADHTLSRVDTHYLNGPAPGGEIPPRGRARIGPTRSWLAGGTPPDCPVLSQRSWTTTGAHLYPAPPGTVPPDDYRSWLTSRHVVYRASGLDPLTLSVPRTPGGSC